MIITDIDSVDNKGKKTYVKKSTKCETANSTIKKWSNFVDNDKTIKYLLNCSDLDKVDGVLRLAYQCENHAEGRNTAYARTFEDSIAMTNVEFFSEIETFGLSKKFKESINENKLIVNTLLSEKLFKDIGGDSGKSNFALDLLFYENKKVNDKFVGENPTQLKTPKYIKDGLEWLDDMLSGKAFEKAVKHNGE